MNKNIDNNRCTIFWHVDDLKTSYFDPTIISSVLADIEAEYGKIEKLSSRGEKYINTLG